MAKSLTNEEMIALARANEGVFVVRMPDGSCELQGGAPARNTDEAEDAPAPPPSGGVQPQFAVPLNDRQKADVAQKLAELIRQSKEQTTKLEESWADLAARPANGGREGAKSRASKWAKIKERAKKLAIRLWDNDNWGLTQEEFAKKVRAKWGRGHKPSESTLIEWISEWLKDGTLAK